MSTSNAVQHLRTLQAVRQQAQRVFQLVKDGKSEVRKNAMGVRLRDIRTYLCGLVYYYAGLCARVCVFHVGAKVIVLLWLL